MTTFAIEKFTKVFISSVNVRAEMHGKDPVPACDIRMRLRGPNTLLDRLSPNLRHQLYRATQEAVSEEAEQMEIDGTQNPATDTPFLRSTIIKFPVGLDREYLGRNIVIDYGMGGKSNIELGPVNVNDLKLEVHDGGTVEIDFRVQASNITNDKILGKLASLVKHDVEITLLSSPEADNTQEKIPGTAPTVTTGQVDIDATDAFIEQHAPKAPAAKKAAPAKKAPAKKATAKARTGKGKP